MSNSLFPTLHGLGWPKRTTMWSSIVHKAASGRTTRIATQQLVLYRWSLPFNYVWDGRYGQQDRQALEGFINQRQGRFDSFLFKDPADNFVAAQSIGAGDGATLAFPVSRTYGGSPDPVDWLQAVANLKVNGVAKSNPADYTFTNAGVITFSVAPSAAQPIVADITFYYRCCFGSDEQEFEQMFNQIWAAKEIIIERVRL